MFCAFLTLLNSVIRIYHYITRAYKVDEDNKVEEEIEKNEFDKYNKFGNDDIKYKHENINGSTIYIEYDIITYIL